MFRGLQAARRRNPAGPRAFLAAMLRCAVLLASFLVATPAAGAATVEMQVEPLTPAERARGTSVRAVIRIADARGERNVLSVRTAWTRVIVRDEAAPLEPGAGCTRADDVTVHCDAPSHLSLEGEVDAGAGDDVVRTGRLLRVLGGPGDDDLEGQYVIGGPGADAILATRISYEDRVAPVTASADGIANDGEAGERDDVRADIALIGGAGDDVLESGPARRAELFVLVGGPGDDDLRGGPGPDLLPAGPGADRMSGGGGRDAALYSEARAPVSVAIDGVANDGETGERDDVGPDVERVVGGAGDDVLEGGAGPESLDGGPGRDVLRGGAGDDELRGFDDATPDTLVGGPGRDDIAGGHSDRIDARDGERDWLFCSGLDTPLLADPRDRARNCAPRIGLAGATGTRLVVRGGVARIVVRCAAESVLACVGTVTLSLRPRGAIAVARGRFRLRPGQRRAVAVRLTRTGTRRLRRSRVLRADVRAVAFRRRPASSFDVYGAVRLVRAARPRSSTASRTTRNPRAS
jgi:hypothetical protein